MGYPIKQSQTAQPLLFFMQDSGSSRPLGKTGLTPTVTLSKNGGSFASPAGAVSEVANGWYKVAGNATDSGTLGPLVLYATASGADPCTEQFAVVAYDPQVAAIGVWTEAIGAEDAGTSLSALHATYVEGIAGPGEIGGLPVLDGNGRVPAQVKAIDNGAITAASIATDAIDADAIATDAVTEIQSGLATAAALSTLSGYVDTEVAAIKAKTDNLPASPAATGDIPSAATIADAVAAEVPPEEFFTNSPAGSGGSGSPYIISGDFTLRILGEGPDGETGKRVMVGTTPTLLLRAITETAATIPMVAPVVAQIVNNATGETVAEDIACTAVYLAAGIVQMQVPSAATGAGMAGKRLRLTLSWTDAESELQIVGGVTLEITAP